jgi:hypothetical protein
VARNRKVPIRHPCSSRRRPMVRAGSVRETPPASFTHCRRADRAGGATAPGQGQIRREPASLRRNPPERDRQHQTSSVRSRTHFPRRACARAAPATAPAAAPDRSATRPDAGRCRTITARRSGRARARARAVRRRGVLHQRASPSISHRGDCMWPAVKPALSRR